MWPRALKATLPSRGYASYDAAQEFRRFVAEPDCVLGPYSPGHGVTWLLGASGGRLREGLHIGVEDADIRPSRRIFGDELRVTWGDLIGVVGRT